MNEFSAAVRAPVGSADGAAPVAVVALAGQLDGAAAAAIDRAYLEAAGDGLEAVVLDFAEVEYINSTGIALIVGLLAKARADDVEVRVCGLTEHYRHIFEITRLADFLSFFDDEPAAVAASRAG